MSWRNQIFQQISLWIPLTDEPQRYSPYTHTPKQHFLSNCFVTACSNRAVLSVEGTKTSICLGFLFRCVWSCNMSGFVDRNSRGGGKSFQSHQWGQSYTININCDSYTWFYCFPARRGTRSAHQHFILSVKLFSFKGLQVEHSKKTTKQRNTALETSSQN